MVKPPQSDPILQQPYLRQGFLIINRAKLLLQKQPSKVILKKRCFENMQQIYKRENTHAEV